VTAEANVVTLDGIGQSEALMKAAVAASSVMARVGSAIAEYEPNAASST